LLNNAAAEHSDDDEAHNDVAAVAG